MDFGAVDYETGTSWHYLAITDTRDRGVDTACSVLRRLRIKRVRIQRDRQGNRRFVSGMVKPLNIPPEAAKAFMADMRAFFIAKSKGLDADAIAARQVHVLRQYQRSHEKPIRLHQVKEMFYAMKDQA